MKGLYTSRQPQGGYYARRKVSLTNSPINGVWSVYDSFSLTTWTKAMVRKSNDTIQIPQLLLLTGKVRL